MVRMSDARVQITQIDGTTGAARVKALRKRTQTPVSKVLLCLDRSFEPDEVRDPAS